MIESQLLNFLVWQLLEEGWNTERRRSKSNRELAHGASLNNKRPHGEFEHRVELCPESEVGGGGVSGTGALAWPCACLPPVNAHALYTKYVVGAVNTLRGLPKAPR